MVFTTSLFTVILLKLEALSLDFGLSQVGRSQVYMARQMAVVSSAIARHGLHTPSFVAESDAVS